MPTAKVRIRIEVYDDEGTEFGYDLPEMDFSDATTVIDDIKAVAPNVTVGQDLILRMDEVAWGLIINEDSAAALTWAHDTEETIVKAGYATTVTDKSKDDPDPLVIKGTCTYRALLAGTGAYVNTGA